MTFFKQFRLPIGSIAAFLPLSQLSLAVAAPTSLIAATPPLSSPSPSSPPIRFNAPSVSDEAFQDMADRGAPDEREGAGTRGECLDTSPPLTALIPLIEGTVAGKPHSLAIGQTSAAHPTLWFYIPYSADKISSARLVLSDDADYPLTEPLTVPLRHSTPGVIGFRLPDQVPSLQDGQIYRWYLLLDCHPTGTTDVSVQGLIQHRALPPEQLQQLESLPPRDRVRWYAERGLWYDALTHLQTLRQTSPDPTLEADWLSILQSVGLEELAPLTSSQPIP